MKDIVIAALSEAIQALEASGKVPVGSVEKIQIERARNRAHGDFASNIALMLAKPAGLVPRVLAQEIVDALPATDVIEKVDLAGPGFINFTLVSASHTAIIDRIREAGSGYGRSEVGVGKSVLVEFVSANPTGPLHVGHGRGAAYGDALLRLLKYAGYAAEAEYYVNDAGRQMHILALSVWLRYLDLAGEEQIKLPDNAYQGDYIWDIAADVHRQNGDAFRANSVQIFSGLPEEPDARMDALIERCQQLIGVTAYQTVFDAGLETLVANIRGDLHQFGVDFDDWFSERSLVESGDLVAAIDALKQSGDLYELEGAWWFRSTDYGDEKDRVVVRANGAHTYFAADIAYLLNKVRRGFDQLVYIWGADHHGYIARVKAAFEALGKDPEKFKVLLVQFAVLYRGGKKVSMSTRGGDFVPLRELREEVGNDAARFFYVMRKSEQHMDFDLDLAKSQSSDNPVYYVQYAHARVCSVYRQLEEKGLNPGQDADYGLLVEQHEADLMTALARFPEVVERAAMAYEPHQIAYYLRDLAQNFHTYYNAHPFISSEESVRNARLALIDAVRQVIANGLAVIGVSAPTSM